MIFTYKIMLLSLTGFSLVRVPPFPSESVEGLPGGVASGGDGGREAGGVGGTRD